MPGIFEAGGFETAADTVGRGTDYASNLSDALLGLAPGNDIYNNTNRPPGPSGAATRQGQLTSGRAGAARRQTMRFFVPEQPIVEMYINPSQVRYQFSKLVTPTRAKGGYILQYWGENLGTLVVQGTTGTSGIEGINVLYDVYRNEQLMFDPYALLIAAERDRAEQASFDDLLFGGNVGGAISGFLGEAALLAGDFLDSKQSQNIINSRSKPTLAQLAFTVEIYWFGEVYRGYFEDFTFTESVQHIGMFEYNFTFKVTQKRGFRTNFFAWHKDPNEGMSNWDKDFGPSKSYSSLTTFRAPPPQPRGDNIFQQIGNGIKKISDKNKDALNKLTTTLVSDDFSIL